MKERYKGFVDLQVNGYMGIDFSSPELTEESFIYACTEIQKKNTIALLPTIITSNIAVYRRNLPLMAKVMKRKQFSKLLPGFHLEGPFITPSDQSRGAHPFDCIKKPSIDLLQQMMKWSDNKLKLITIAADVKGADKLCAFATKNKIIVSLGHHMADEKAINTLATSGAKALTHLGNGLPHLLNRHYNPIWAGLANEKLTAMIIADGSHLPVSLIKTIIKVKGLKNTILVSDVSPIGGMKPGIYKLWGMDIALKKDGLLYNPKTGFFAGSSCTMKEEADFLLKEKILTIAEINQIAHDNPMRMIGIKR